MAQEENNHSAVLRQSGHCKRHVLLVGPRYQDRAAVYMISESMKEYTFHFLEPDSSMVYGPVLPSTEYSENLNFLGFIKKAVDYVHQNNITGILFSYDIMALTAAAVCQETGLPGPSFECEFICHHKYYSRLAEPSKLWCESVTIPREPQQLKIDRLRGHFPCFIKPSALTGSVGVSKLNTFADLQEKLTSYCQSLPRLAKAFQPLFHQYLDMEKYPLANVASAVVEEYIDDNGCYHCFEGWADSKGEIHHWATYDSIAVPVGNENLVGFFIPTMEKASSVQAIVSYAQGVVKNHKLKSTFFNVDIWKRGERIDVIEVNGRCTLDTVGIYQKLYDSCVFKVMTYLACGEDEKCYKESPQRKQVPSKVGGYFCWYTNREGKASDILNLSLARTIGEKEEIYNVSCEQSAGITLLVDEDSHVPRGTQVGNFALFATNRAQLLEKSKQLVSQLCNNKMN